MCTNLLFEKKKSANNLKVTYSITIHGMQKSKSGKFYILYYSCFGGVFFFIIWNADSLSNKLRGYGYEVKKKELKIS